jgi:epoxide hydrolase-like predicted phosphatase
MVGMKERMMRQHPQLLLFDLGGVLVEFSGFRDLAPLLRIPRLEADIRQQWIACPTIRAFEVGQLTPQQFAERFVAAWDVAVTPTAFLRAFRTWTRGFLPGAREVLTALRGRFRLACLSNSNATHWERNTQELGLLTHFEAALSSHVLGCHKPDPLIYHRALAPLHVAPETVVFFDDVAANVEAAQEVGITAFQVAGVTELRSCLSRLGLLHSPEQA